MATKIIIAEIGFNKGWYNIKTNNNEELSVCTTDGKNPKLAAILKDSKEGSEVEMEVVEKNGKKYGWDVKENKGFKAKDKSFEAAGSAGIAAASLLSLKKDVTIEEYDKWFHHIHALIMDKATKPTNNN